MEDEDLAVVRNLQSGDDSALNTLIERHKAGLFSFIYRYIRQWEDAVDLTQETFVRAYFKISSYKPTAKFVTWLYSIAINLCRDHARSSYFRKAKMTMSLPERGLDCSVELVSSGDSPDKIAVSKEDMRGVEQAIAQLPHKLKTALILCALEGLSHAEAAERLGTTSKTIETRLYRARKELENQNRRRPT